MEEELGCSIAEVFSSISERPIAAASLGQARPPAPLCHVQWSREAVLERTGSRVHCLVLCCAFALSEFCNSPAGGRSRGVYEQRACRGCDIKLWPIACAKKYPATHARSPRVRDADMRAALPGSPPADVPWPTWGASDCSRAARQVYKAVLRDTGEDVAIKVQRPGVRPVILRDLFIFRSMARFINPISKVCSRLFHELWRRHGFFFLVLAKGMWCAASSLFQR